MEPDTVHEVIGRMSEWERGWYHAAIETILWNSTYIQEKTKLDGGEYVTMRMPIEYEDGEWIIARYSPSGTQRHAESFYSETPPDADDLITIKFDELNFRATWMEIDSEAALMFYQLVKTSTEFVTDLEIRIACSETDLGVPGSWELWPDNTPDFEL